MLCKSQEIGVSLKLDCLQKLLWSKVLKIADFITAIYQLTERAYIGEVIKLNDEVYISFVEHKGPLTENALL